MLPKKNRADKKLVTKIFQKGTLVGSFGLSFKYILEEELNSPKVSFVVPKAVEKRAVRRNFLRRRGYLILKKYFTEIPKGVSGVFLFKRNITLLEIENEIKRIINKIN